jgi:hypothetical protein
VPTIFLSGSIIIGGHAESLSSGAHSRDPVALPPYELPRSDHLLRHRIAGARAELACLHPVAVASVALKPSPDQNPPTPARGPTASPRRAHSCRRRHWSGGRWPAATAGGGRSGCPSSSARRPPGSPRTCRGLARRSPHAAHPSARAEQRLEGLAGLGAEQRVVGPGRGVIDVGGGRNDVEVACEHQRLFRFKPLLRILEKA